MPDNDHIKAVDRFLSNHSDYAEAERICTYLRHNTDALDAIDLYDHIEDEEVIKVSQSHKDAIVTKIIHKKSKVWALGKRLLVAAGIIGIIFFTARFFVATDVKKEVLTHQIRNNTTALMNYVLPDSSRAILKPGAAICFQTDFTDKRNVSVFAGEVYFKVRKNKKSAFVVAVNGVNVTALGTEFWVQHFQNKQIDLISISLKEGKVRLNSADKSFYMDTVFLSPGFTCNINKRTGEVVVLLTAGTEKVSKGSGFPSKNTSLNDRIGNIVWTDAEIQFYHAPLKNLFKKIENRYQVKIIADTAISNINLTGKIYHTDSLHMIMKTICELNNMLYEKKNDTLFIKKH